MSQLDWIYRRFLVTQIFTKGWGKPDHLRRIFNFRKKISKREICRHLVSKDYPVYIDKETKTNGFRLLDGHFMSPLVELLPGIVPKEVQIARFQMLLPAEWKSNLKPMCLHLGGTGDHGFWRRKKLMAIPLLKEEGIGSIILENPYYGCRKPKEQLRSSLHNVSDLFVMGAGLILESLVIFNWCERMGYGPLGATGISMGGHMASLAATNWHKPLSLIPCLSWSTASGVFTHGVLSSAIPWKVLQHQYSRNDVYDKEIRELIESPEPYWKTGAYSSGQEFARRITESSETDLASNGSENITEKFISESLKDKYTGHSPLHIGDQCLESSNLECASLDSSTEGTVSLSSSAGGTVNLKSSVKGGKISSNGNMISVIGEKVSSMKRAKLSKAESVKSELEKDCKLFMRGVMDECTHLGNFSVPVDPELVIIVAADHDSYIPREDVLRLDKLWPGSEVRYIPTGHIMAFLYNQGVFRQKKKHIPEIAEDSQTDTIITQ